MYKKQSAIFCISNCMRKIVVLSVIFTLSVAQGSLLQQQKTGVDYKKNIFSDIKEFDTCSSLRSRRCKGTNHVKNFLSESFENIFCLHKNIFSLDTARILMYSFPFFISGRMIDERLQSCFFDMECRVNHAQPPKWCREIARISLGFPIAFLGSQVFLSRDDQAQTTAKIMLTGLPFLWFAKDIIKKLRFDENLRPHHETLSPYEKVSGGFPSGHVAGSTYLAVLYGLQYGPKGAIPLGLLTVFIGSVFLTCNRHYLSQLIAGASFGTIYGLAAHKLTQSKLCYNENIQIDLGIEMDKGASVSVSWQF